MSRCSARSASRVTRLLTTYSAMPHESTASRALAKKIRLRSDATKVIAA
jgi:hypothetical protein